MSFTRRTLTTYLVAMTLLNGFMAWRSWRGVPLGLPDFSSFYTAARIMHDGNAARLYDGALQETVQRSFAPTGVSERNAILPYNHPPFEALLLAPLARFSYVSAYLLWLAGNLLMLLGMMLLLRDHFVVLGKLPLYLWFLACFGFYPIIIALLQGQDSILVLFCYSLAFLSLRRNAEFRAGAWLGLGLCKFQLVLPFVFPLFLLRRSPRLVLGFITVAVLLTLAGFLAVGWSGLLSYPKYIMQTEPFMWGGMPNLRGLVAALLPTTLSYAMRALLVAGSTTLFGVLVYCWVVAYPAGVACREMLFALSLLGTVLLSYHLYLYDFSVLFLAILILLEVMASSAKRAWMDFGMYACMTALFCSPICILLPIRNQVMAGILLMFFLLLTSAVIREARNLRPGTA